MKTKLTLITYRCHNTKVSFSTFIQLPLNNSGQPVLNIDQLLLTKGLPLPGLLDAYSVY